MNHKRFEYLTLHTTSYKIQNHYHQRNNLLAGINIARAMKTIDVIAVFKREEAKPARDTHPFMVTTCL